MKLLVLFGVVFAAAVLSEARFISGTAEDVEFSKGLLCIATEGLLGYADSIANIMARDEYPVDDVKFNKFFGCYWKVMGLLDDDGQLDKDNLEKYLQILFADGGKVNSLIKLLAQNTVEECKDTEGANYGQKAVKVQNCMLAYLSQFPH